MQIPYLIDWRSFFGDLETWHIWATTFVNQNYEIQKYFELKKFKIKNRKDFLEAHVKVKNKIGINAMSISNITGIPRATVVRKLNKLLKAKHMVIDNKKLYYPNTKNHEENPVAKLSGLSVKKLSIFLSNILNLAIISK